MFRSMRRQLLLTRNRPVFIPSNGIADLKRPRELNTVKLMGTIADRVTYLNNGAIKLRLRTTTEDSNDCIHNVAIANRNLIQMVQKKLAPDQRIYIAGKLKTENFRIDHEYRQELEILANELFFLEPNPKLTDANEMPMQMDENFVEMLAFVGTSVWNQRNISAFSIVTHFTKQKGKREESEGMEYHRVVIHKNLKMQQLALNLQKLDRIYLTGFINYANEMYPNGNEYVNGFIEVTNLVKLRKFDK